MSALSRPSRSRPPASRPERQRARRGFFPFTLDPGAVITFSPSCGPTSCHSSICGSPLPTLTMSTRSAHHCIVIGIFSGFAGAGSYHPVRGQQHHVPAAACAGMGGAGLCRRLFRLLCKDVLDMSNNAERVGPPGAKPSWPRQLLVFSVLPYLNLSLPPAGHLRYSHINQRLARLSRLAGGVWRCAIPRSPPASRGCRWC